MVCNGIGASLYGWHANPFFFLLQPKKCYLRMSKKKKENPRRIQERSHQYIEKFEGGS